MKLKVAVHLVRDSARKVIAMTENDLLLSNEFPFKNIIIPSWIYSGHSVVLAYMT